MTERRLRQAILQVLPALPLLVTAPLYRSWHLRWGATGAEVRGGMPGDAILPEASFAATRAITINAPPGAVWPWIVQMGYRRAGFYSYDLLDNAGHDSADRILADYQQPKVGDWMPMAGKPTDATAFKVHALRANQWLLWTKPDSTWAWTLSPLSGGRARLVTRLKARYPWETPGYALLSLVLLELGDFPMMRRALKGIKARAEAQRPPGGGASYGSADRTPASTSVPATGRKELA